MIRFSWLTLLVAAPLAAQQPDSVRKFPVTRSVTVDSVVVYRTRVVHDTLKPPTDTTPPPPVDTTPPPPPPVAHAGWQVTPGGTSSGDGSAAKPWDLQTALNTAGGKVTPGDTVWLRGGPYPAKTYTCPSSTKGTATAPLIFRVWPGERATVRNRVEASCAYTWLWGWEIVNTALSQNVHGVNIEGSPFSGFRAINLIISNQSGNGIYESQNALDTELYGNILLNNGFCGSGGGPPPNSCSSFGHGIYAQNNTGRKLIQDNLILGGFGYGLHAYAETVFLKNFTIDGNAAVNNGQSPDRGNNFLVGGGTPVSGLVFTHNMAYAAGTLNAGTWIGRVSAQNADAIVRGNVMGRGYPAFRFFKWTSLTVDSNRIVGVGQPGSLLDQIGGIATWTRNSIWGTASTNEVTKDGAGMTYAGWKQATGLGASDSYTSGVPTSQWVYVRPNKYEPGRANVIVYNWTNAASAKVDLSAVLKAGQAFEVRNAQDYFGPLVASGTYTGGLITVPIVAVIPPKPLQGADRIGTGTAFVAYVVLPK